MLKLEDFLSKVSADLEAVKEKEEKDGKKFYTVTATVKDDKLKFKKVAGFKIDGDTISDEEAERISSEDFAKRRIQALFQILSNMVHMLKQLGIKVTGQLENAE